MTRRISREIPRGIRILREPNVASTSADAEPQVGAALVNDLRFGDGGLIFRFGDGGVIFRFGDGGTIFRD